MPHYGRKKRPTLDQQVFVVSNQLPGLTRINFVPNKAVVWDGYLQPSPLSKRYRVRIEFQVGSRPDVTLPDLDFSVERPPHLFPDDTLCLYSSKGIGAWDSSMWIKDLVPMIAHWLWCYEVWKIDKIWHGEEFPHPEGSKKEKI